MAIASLRLSMVIVTAPLFAGCPGDYGEAPFACAQSSLCPEGYRCVDKVCRRQPGPGIADARGDRSDRATPPDLRDRREGTLGLEPPRVDLYRAPDILKPDTYKPDVYAGLTCREIDDCYRTCQPYQTACFNACFNKGSPDGKAKMQALDLCYDKWCYACRSEWACAACEKQYCANELTACGF